VRGNTTAGPSSATQNANSTATTNVANNATTNQGQSLNQNLGVMSGKTCGCSRGGYKQPQGGCSVGCGGNGGFQLGVQLAGTNQWAAGFAVSEQNAVNSNTPHSTAGGNIYAGPSNALQNAGSTGTTGVGNTALTNQAQGLN
jgi:hypothetical protein